jgi:hypothetical protein
MPLVRIPPFANDHPLQYISMLSSPTSLHHFHLHKTLDSGATAPVLRGWRQGPYNNLERVSRLDELPPLPRKRILLLLLPLLEHWELSLR